MFFEFGDCLKLGGEVGVDVFLNLLNFRFDFLLIVAGDMRLVVIKFLLVGPFVLVVMLLNQMGVNLTYPKITCGRRLFISFSYFVYPSLLALLELF